MSAGQDEKTGQNIFGRYQAGLQNVGSYQVSGVPFVSGSDNLDAGVEHKIEFGAVAKKVTIRNPGAEILECILLLLALVMFTLVVIF